MSEFIDDWVHVLENENVKSVLQGIRLRLSIVIVFLYVISMKVCYIAGAK